MTQRQCQGMDSDRTQCGELGDGPPEWSQDSMGNVGSVVHGEGIKGPDQDLGNMLSTLPNGRSEERRVGKECA